MGSRRHLGRRAGALVALLLTAALTAQPTNANAQDPIPTVLFSARIADWLRTAGPNTFWASLRESGTNSPVPDATVELWLKAYGQDEFRLAGTDVSDELGNVQVSVKIFRNSRIKWKYAGDATYLSSVSLPYTEFISPRVSIQVSDVTPKVGQRVVFTGGTTPDRPGKRVAVYRGHTSRGGFGPPHNPPVRLARGRVHADGTYRLVVRFVHPGRKNVYVQVAGGTGNAPGWSAYRRIDVT